MISTWVLIEVPILVSALCFDWLINNVCQRSKLIGIRTLNRLLYFWWIWSFSFKAPRPKQIQDGRRRVNFWTRDHPNIERYCPIVWKLFLCQCTYFCFKCIPLRRKKKNTHTLNAQHVKNNTSSSSNPNNWGSSASYSLTAGFVWGETRFHVQL